MKPVRIGRGTMKELDLSKYTLEKKYDGHRAMLIVEAGRKLLFTRRKNSIAVPKDLEEHLKGLDMEDGTVLDGEIWNPTKRGGWTAEGGHPSMLTFWDCIREGGSDISQRPIEERRAALGRIVGEGNEGVQVMTAEETFGEQRVEEIFQETSKLRKETKSRSGFVHGVVLKLRGSRRRDHATRTQEHPDWMKIVFDGMSGWG